MVLNKGGYVMINKAQDNVYELAKSALTSGKPILWYESNTECYFIDTITLSGTDIILTKGGKTIIINDTNSVSSEGIVSNPTMENIVDLAGNKRFIEGDLEEGSTPIIFNFAKWSLSGTHLMLVLVGEIPASTTINQTTTLAKISFGNLPKYILDKIIPVIGSNIEIKTINVFSEDTTILTTYDVRLGITSDDTPVVFIDSGETKTFVNKGLFRLQFDLLIDTE